MTIEEARDYWSKRLERAESYSVEHLDADERHAYADYIDALKHAITALAMRREYAEAKESKARGKWHPVRSVYGLTKYVCSLCGHFVPGGSDRSYCPNCGARMDGDKDEGN